MVVKSILSSKGSEVHTLRGDQTIAEAVEKLNSCKVGALVVTDGDGAIEGILSERDVVRSLSKHGAATLQKPVKDLMTAPVTTCTEQATIPELMNLMTTGRFRHLPVERDGKLIGIVSIGDVVKGRIAQVEQEADQIREYITAV